MHSEICHGIMLLSEHAFNTEKKIIDTMRFMKYKFVF